MTAPPSQIPWSWPPMPPMPPPSSSKQLYIGLVGQKSRLGPQLAAPNPMTAASAQTLRNHFMASMMVSQARPCQGDVRPPPTRSPPRGPAGLAALRTLLGREKPRPALTPPDPSPTLKAPCVALDLSLLRR